MNKPFRWNINKRSELGSLIDEKQIEVEEQFINELLKSAARVIAFSDNSKLYFVGRSPENYFDLLKGMYYNTQIEGRLNLFQFSGRYLDKYEIEKVNSQRIKSLRMHMTEIGLSPRGILKNRLNTALIDLVYTGSTFKNLVTLLKHWSLEEKQDWKSIKSKIRIVGITERTKNSPNTWRWHQQADAKAILDGIKVKNVSVTWKFWTELGNNQKKVTPSNSPDKWESGVLVAPTVNEEHLKGLNFAFRLSKLGMDKQIKSSFLSMLKTQNEMKLKWFKEWQTTT